MNPDTKLIPLTQGLHAIVDAADYDWLAQWKWCISAKHGVTYASSSMILPTSSRRAQMYMHRFIMGMPDGKFIDHINHNGLDNRRDNLRICSPKENQRNRQSRPNSSSQYLGVSWVAQRGKWLASIRVGNVGKNLGRFDCEIRAALAYDAAARLHHGEFANPNFENER